MATKRLKAVVGGPQFSCPAMKHVPIGQFTCQEFCKSGASNQRFCTALQCASPWRLCLKCVLEKRFDRDSIVVDQEMGLCPRHTGGKQSAVQPPRTHPRPLVPVHKPLIVSRPKPPVLMTPVEKRRVALETITRAVHQEKELAHMVKEIERWLSERSFEELEEIRADLPRFLAAKKAEAEAARQRERERKVLALYRRWEQDAQTVGLTPKKLIALAEKAADSNGHPKAAPSGKHHTTRGLHRNPRNPSQTWMGMGKRPNWVKEHLVAGGTLEDLRVM